jgi:hypothetical protein
MSVPERVPEYRVKLIASCTQIDCLLHSDRDLRVAGLWEQAATETMDVLTEWD